MLAHRRNGDVGTIPDHSALGKTATEFGCRKFSFCLKIHHEARRIITRRY
jgi:hypothetical protein